MKRTFGVFVALGTAAAGLLLATPSASADSCASTDGARACFESYGDNFELSDTGCDSHSVYLKYKVSGGGEQRADYSGGCGTSSLINRDFPEGARVDYRACVNIQLGADRCGGWTTDYA